PTKRGKGTLSPMITVFLSPLVSKALRRTKTSLNQLVEGLLGQSFLDTLPARLMGDRAYDSDRLDRDLAREDTLERDAVKIGSLDSNPACSARNTKYSTTITTCKSSYGAKSVRSHFLQIVLMLLDCRLDPTIGYTVTTESSYQIDSEGLNEGVFTCYEEIFPE